MDKELKAAFEGSIKKWEDIVNVAEHASNCDMCIHMENTQTSCDDCPLSGPGISCCDDLYHNYTDDPSEHNAGKVLDYIKASYEELNKQTG